jgi:phage gp37-like protein
LQTFANETGLDSRFQIQDFKKVLESRRLDSRFKIEDFKKVLESRRLDSRFKIQDFKKVLESRGLGFNIQDSRPRRKLLNPAFWIQELF